MLRSKDRSTEVLTHGGKKNTGLNPVKWAKEIEKLGAGEIFLNSIDRDGMMSGYDLKLNKQNQEETK